MSFVFYFSTTFDNFRAANKKNNDEKKFEKPRFEAILKDMTSIKFYNILLSIKIIEL